MLTFNEYRSNADHDSEQWAASDRGWAWDRDRDATTCFAHYLRYDHGPDGKRIHVVIVRRGACGIVWVRTCAEARLAIRAAYKRARRASLATVEG